MKVIIIFGCTSAIGKSIVDSFLHSSSHRIIATYFSSDPDNYFDPVLYSKFQSRLSFIPLDVSDFTAISEFFTHHLLSGVELAAFIFAAGFSVSNETPYYGNSNFSDYVGTVRRV